MKAIVVAMDEVNGIGADNDLLWRLPADLKHFKDITMGGSIIMGRKTFESIGRALPGRQNIVISRSSVEYPDIIHADSVERAYELATSTQVFVIGGGEIYKQTINDVDVLYVTHVHETFQAATVLFPQISPDTWKETLRIINKADDKNKFDYDFVKYERI